MLIAGSFGINYLKYNAYTAQQFTLESNSRCIKNCASYWGFLHINSEKYSGAVFFSTWQKTKLPENSSHIRASEVFLSKCRYETHGDQHILLESKYKYIKFKSWHQSNISYYERYSKRKRVYDNRHFGEVSFCCPEWLNTIYHQSIRMFQLPIKLSCQYK